MPYARVKALLNDIGTEELAHLEIVGSIVHQLLDEATDCELKEQYAPGFVEHGLGIYPMGANGSPFTAAYIASEGDAVVDLTEDIAAEQKARITYEYLMRMTDDPDVIDPLKFLREREVVHFNRFSEALAFVNDAKDEKKCY